MPCVQLPFADEAATRRGNLDTSQLSGVSPEAVQLLLSVLQRVPQARCTAAQALNSAWIVRHEQHHATYKLQSPLDVGVVRRMRRYSRYSKVKQQLLLRLADTASHRELKDLQRQFLRMDTDHNGYLSAAEVKAALREFKTGEDGARVYSDRDIDQVLLCPGLLAA
jgi:hypothetical protein